MRDDQFDKEIADLYQQRKSQVVAPNVLLSESLVKNKRSLLSLFSIFTLGGIASFGIMAIVTHFAKSPFENHQESPAQHQVYIADQELLMPVKKVILKRPALPPKPMVLALKVKQNLLAPIKKNTQVNGVDNFDLNAVQIVTLPHIKEPRFTIIPVYKVMPKYSNRAMQDNKTGAIRLRYEIDDAGNVINIHVVDSEVSRDLQQSAKKALSKWKYNSSDALIDSYEIIFEFTSGEG
jgi:protein TonB